MPLDLEAIRSRLNKLQSNSNRNNSVWKPTPGKHQVRILPYKFSPDVPFIELLFHYNINGKTYLSPASFGRPDPIVEFAEKLKKIGSKDDWKSAKKMEPRLRIYAPIVVRGEEHAGVKFWGFGKQVYQNLFGYIADPDYGDITDPTTGRDIIIEYTEAEKDGAYPDTAIRIKPNTTPLSTDPNTMQSLLDNQPMISEVFQELSYDELKKVFEKWLNPDGGDVEIAESVSQTTLSISPTKDTAENTVQTDAIKTSVNNAASAFEDLFSEL